MDSDGASLKLSGADEANDYMDTDGAVAREAASGEKESAICDIIDDIIDAAVNSSVAENRSGQVGINDCTANYADCEVQQDMSSACVSDRPDSVETHDVSACDDAADSKAVSRQVASAVAENRSDTSSSSSSPSTSSISPPDTDESDRFGGYTVNQVDSDSEDVEHRGESAADTPAAGAESGHARVSREERARRKRQRSFLLRSSSSNSPSSSSDSEAESDVEAKASRLDDCQTGFQLPADSWKPLTEIVERQYGRFRGRPRNPVIFTQRAGGSVVLGNRLTLYAKHTVHDGCVNALHFNESGQ